MSVEVEVSNKRFLDGVQVVCAYRELQTIEKRLLGKSSEKNGNNGGNCEKRKTVDLLHK